jgi:hypothetical protein
MKSSRAATVAKLIRELSVLKPQMLSEESEYRRLADGYPDYLCFKIAAERRDLKRKILWIGSSSKHIRLAQELAAAHFGRAFTTIQHDWSHHKPTEFKQPGSGPRGLNKSKAVRRRRNRQKP